MHKQKIMAKPICLFVDEPGIARQPLRTHANISNRKFNDEHPNAVAQTDGKQESSKTMHSFSCKLSLGCYENQIE